MFPSTHEKESQSSGTERGVKRLVLCLDGTWSSTYDEVKRRDDHTVLKPTNTLKICRAVRPTDDRTGQLQIAYYDIGVGSLADYSGVANWLLVWTACSAEKHAVAPVGSRRWHCLDRNEEG